MASCRRCSLLLSDASIMREPTLMMRPPNRLASTWRSTATLRPTALRNCSSTAARCAGDRSWAAITEAVTSPRRSASRRRKLALISGSTKRRRLRASSPRKFRVSGESCACGNGLDGLALLLARQHRAADQAAELSAVAQHGAQRLEVGGHGVEFLALVGEIEQRRAIALSEPGYAFRFGC